MRAAAPPASGPGPVPIGPRLPVVLLLTAAGLALPAGVASGAVPSVGPSHRAVMSTGGDCPAADTRIELQSRVTSVTATAPTGYLVAAYCVRAGSPNGVGAPESVTLDQPAASVTVRHSSGKAVEYYTLTYVAVPAPEPTQPSEPPAQATPTPEPSATVEATSTPSAVAASGATASPTGRASATGEQTQVPADDDAGVAAAAERDDSSGGGTAWVVAAIVGALGLGAAPLMWWRRRTGDGFGSGSGSDPGTPGPDGLPSGPATWVLAERVPAERGPGPVVGGTAVDGGATQAGAPGPDPADAPVTIPVYEELPDDALAGLGTVAVPVVGGPTAGHATAGHPTAHHPTAHHAMGDHPVADHPLAEHPVADLSALDVSTVEVEGAGDAADLRPVPPVLPVPPVAPRPVPVAEVPFVPLGSVHPRHQAERQAVQRAAGPPAESEVSPFDLDPAEGGIATPPVQYAPVRPYIGESGQGRPPAR